ncbi:MAG: PaaI family thioesterase [Rhizobiales bacterium]|nr:PaaI family thioesterase [Hyphomicrobiales bacterium]
MSHAVMSIPQLDAFLARDFPQVFTADSLYTIVSLGYRECVMRCRFDERHLRPGGTISGPTMMTLADVGLYVAILASVGPVAMAVTTNLNINFLRKPAPRDLIAETKLMRLGRRLAVGEVAIYSEGDEEMVAHVTGTYAIPQERPDA